MYFICTEKCELLHLATRTHHMKPDDVHLTPTNRYGFCHIFCHSFSLIFLSFIRKQTQNRICFAPFLCVCTFFLLSHFYEVMIYVPFACYSFVYACFFLIHKIKRKWKVKRPSFSLSGIKFQLDNHKHTLNINYLAIMTEIGFYFNVERHGNGLRYDYCEY